MFIYNQYVVYTNKKSPDGIITILLSITNKIPIIKCKLSCHRIKGAYESDLP